MSAMSTIKCSSQLARWRAFITASDEGIRFSAQLQATITPQTAPAAAQLVQGHYAPRQLSMQGGCSL